MGKIRDHRRTRIARRLHLTRLFMVGRIPRSHRLSARAFLNRFGINFLFPDCDWKATCSGRVVRYEIRETMAKSSGSRGDGRGGFPDSLRDVVPLLASHRGNSCLTTPLVFPKGE